MRRRLTYANVMATLAFFFALAGGSMAATKYLQASDPITHGDLAGSTYGSPVIASGKVTTGKIADGAVTSSKFDSSATAPNAAKLEGFDVIPSTTGFAGTVGANGGTATAVAGCPADRVAIHVVSLSGGPDLQVTGELWSGLLRHSDLQVLLENTGAQDEPLNSITLDCFGTSS